MRGAEAMPALFRISQVTAIFAALSGMLPVHALPSLTAQKFVTNLGARFTAVGEQHRGKIRDCIDESQSAAAVNLKIRNKPFDYFEPADGYAHFIGALASFMVRLW